MGLMVDGGNKWRHYSRVILEGDPQPNTIRGRMSFQSFNPSIDKLNEEETANGHDAEASSSSAFQSGRRSERENRPSEHIGVDIANNNVDGKHKRKQLKEFCQTSHPKKLQKNTQGNKQPSSRTHSLHNQPKRDELLRF